MYRYIFWKVKSLLLVVQKMERLGAGGNKEGKIYTDASYWVNSVCYIIITPKNMADTFFNGDTKMALLVLFDLVRTVKCILYKEQYHKAHYQQQPSSCAFTFL